MTTTPTPNGRETRLGIIPTNGVAYISAQDHDTEEMVIVSTLEPQAWEWVIVTGGAAHGGVLRSRHPLSVRDALWLLGGYIIRRDSRVPASVLASAESVASLIDEACAAFSAEAFASGKYGPGDVRVSVGGHEVA